jgi:biopolymer transport protein TolR
MNYQLEVCLVALTLITGVTPSVAAQSQQAMRKGISVELPVTKNAVAMPDADQGDAVIVSVTDGGGVYLGVNPISPVALAETVKRGLANRTEKKLYIKADARTPYANVLKVLDAAHTADVEALNLLTAQRDSSESETLVPPKGLEVSVGLRLHSRSEAIVVQVLNSGPRKPTLRVDDENIPWAALQSTLRQFFQNRKEKVVLMKAEGTLPFADVVDVTDACRSTGAKVVLLTQEP